MEIAVGARSSPLSQTQLEEVLQAIVAHHPQVAFKKILCLTTGDRDLTQSLRNLDKSNFFTKEIDEMLLAGSCRIAIHSAKDLPEPLPWGLKLIALTRGVDPSDVLAMREGESFETLPIGALVATSSSRREENVKLLRKDLKFCDLRGTIGDRLALLDRRQVDGVVVAEAALIRLQLTHLNRIVLPGSTTPLQGQLAILCREGDIPMEELFAPLDVRRP
jgi:hydroxymethylbilane synthase